MRSYQNFSLGIAAVCLILATSGCVPLLLGAAAGAGGVAYVRGAAVKNVDENVKDIHKATLAAFKEMGVFVTADELNNHSSLIKAEYEDGKKIQVNIEALTEFVSKVTVRSGAIGNPEESELILSTIENQL